MGKNALNMKNVLFTACLIVAGATIANAQFSLGLKGGITSPQDQYKDISVGNNDAGYNLAVKDVKFGTLIGGYMRFGRKIYIQPEVLFQTNRTDYQISTPGTGESVVRRSSYQNLQIPLVFGLKAGPFRFHAGPVANYFLSGNSGLSDIDGFNETWDELTWGWLGGLTIGNGRLSADLRYEGNFNKFGEQISFLGQDYNFSQRPMSFVFALNYALVK
jgi:Outer membrane protein beta-barrel domain